ncbi:putative HVA22-like protein g isoform X2 [Brachypodium distachyon]|uniref:HVA22-like protein n=1 Tax=Brachypodium distachyon TaxID=15368 RepID=I1IXK3_BRADI|nr:putative HVA22-like protein g isoform X2 [Brachypodium distachyon]KQJ82542.1 hypothetical protein BRADI_5g09570v3 [Brachypodium distachyon]|eukprot:XP_010239885.1 putative HVA22-like protein g isoform X2 [Brachypodium distachyon]
MLCRRWSVSRRSSSGPAGRINSGFGASIGTDPEALISEIILVILVIFDEIAGALISRIPMYYELKLAFLVYLWYPQTRGTDIVYETFVRPLVMQYEPNIEERLRYLRANAGDLIVFYLKNFTDRGYELFLRALDYVRSQASRGSRTRRFFSFRGDRGERPSFVEDDYVPGGDRRRAARQRRPGPGDY